MWKNNQHSYPFFDGWLPFPGVGLLFQGVGFPFSGVGLPFPGFGLPFLDVGLPFPGFGFSFSGGLGRGGGGPTHNCYKEDANYI